MAALLALGVSCDNDDTKIIVYRAAKETPAPAAEKPAAPAALHWSAPAGWEEQPASGFRKGSFLVRAADGKTADISVISFPEEAGGLVANVNRWREQLKLTPLAADAATGESFSVAGHEMHFVDFASEAPIAPADTKVRILGGVFALPGETWFFKMMGPDALVAAQREAFQAFLRSVHVSDAERPHSSAQGGQSTNALTPPLLESTGGPPLQFTLPPGWEEKPLAPMRAASFKVNAANGKELDVSVVTLSGAAGGRLANINRWREQVKLPAVDEAALQQAAEHIQADGHDYLVVDLVSAEPLGEQNEKQRILAAILETNDRSWFIKMTGEEAAVAAQKNAFTDFLRSLKVH